MRHLASLYTTWVFQSHCIVYRFGNTAPDCILYLLFFSRIFLCPLYGLLYSTSAAECSICFGQRSILCCLRSSRTCTAWLVKDAVLPLCGFDLSWYRASGYALFWQFCFFLFLSLAARDLGRLPVTIDGGYVGRTLQFRIVNVYGWGVWCLCRGCGRPRQFPPAAAHLKFARVVA